MLIIRSLNGSHGGRTTCSCASSNDSEGLESVRNESLSWNISIDMGLTDTFERLAVTQMLYFEPEGNFPHRPEAVLSWCDGSHMYRVATRAAVCDSFTS